MKVLHPVIHRPKSLTGWLAHCKWQCSSNYQMGTNQPTMVLCSVSCLPLLFITLIVIWHRFICDCVHFFLLIVNLLLILGFILIMCVFAAFFRLSLLFLFAVLFYLYTVLGYVWVCNFSCLHLTFSVLLHAFWWWMLCLIVLFSVYFTSSPYHPVCFLFVCCCFFS